MSINRRDFVKAAAVTSGATALTLGAVRSFIPEAKAGQPLTKNFDVLPVKDGSHPATGACRLNLTFRKAL